MPVVPDTLEIELGELRLQALLGVPAEAEGLVIFAHGSGSGRLSPRNSRVAAALRDAGLATVELSVQGENAGATRLYESVGMTAVWTIERWEKTLQPHA